MEITRRDLLAAAPALMAAQTQGGATPCVISSINGLRVVTKAMEMIHDGADTLDAVIAALLLAILWKDYRSGALTDKDLETAAFNVFLYGRMIGAAAEIDDHLNRGRNMDTRTPQEQCAFVV